MKLNNKGFTLIEMLAAVTILGVLSGIAITAYTKYQDKVRKEAYAAMESSAYSATQNYIQERGVIVPVENDDGILKNNEYISIDVDTLVNNGYLQKLEDPATKKTYCHSGSEVKVSKKASSGTTLEKYKFRVTIKCKNYTSSGVVFES